MRVLHCCAVIFQANGVYFMAAKSILDKLEYAVPKMRLLLVNETTKLQKRVTIKSPLDAAKLLTPLRHASEEYFISLHLNAKNEVIGIHEVSHGTLSTSLVHPREVFKAALLANSHSIIVCHNHPSGASIEPSKEDLDTTRQLLRVGNLVGISVIDHLIVGPSASEDPDEQSVYSCRENLPHLWTEDR